MRISSLILTLLAGTAGPAQDKPPVEPPRAAPVLPLKAAAPAERKLTPLQQQMHQSALRGAAWLRNAHRPDGRFTPGHLPALRAIPHVEPLQQYRAAYALACAARAFQDERLLALARQAVLTQLLDTTLEDGKSPVRYTALPGTVLNRVQAAAWLILAVNALPEPGADLLAQSEQLCEFLRRQQRPDGSLCLEHPLPKDAALEDSKDRETTSSALALVALLVSQQHRPASWKAETVGRALAAYYPQWAQAKGLPASEWQTAAATLGFLQTKHQAYAQVVFRACDALCQAQVTQLDPRRPLWLGAFDDPAQTGQPPTVATAAYAQNLADGCRLARELNDLPRYQRYREAQERSLQFLTTLQFTEANTQHFADWYRPALLGSFFTHHQDGTVRLDHTQLALSALLRYLGE